MAFVILYFGARWIFIAANFGEPLVGLGVALLAAALLAVPLFRVGLLSMLVTFIVGGWLNGFPLTLDSSVWFFGDSMATLAVVLGLALWAFYHSLGGRSIFGDEGEEAT